ncbi:MAG: hypothetical protein IPI57_12645 [Candidatus Competibacteraceae bacterium]|nr:hypothetical protein [Candidatus Competibacteraceae bacterium]
MSLPDGTNHTRPAPITKAIARVQTYYRQPRENRWDELSQGERHHRLERQLPAVGGTDTAAGRALVKRLARWRQQRSERREALVAVLMLLLGYTDIATLTVAVPSGDGWLGLSGPWIAAHTGLSPSRVKRALATLSRSGLLAGTGQGRRFDRRRRCWLGAGWGPVRRFSFRLVRALGLEVSWDRAKKRLRKRRNPPQPVATAPCPTPVPVIAASAAAAIDSSVAAGKPAALPAPLPAGDRAAGAEHVRTLRQQLLSPAARQADTDPAARRADIERNRLTAELAAQGLSPAEIRERLNQASRPP